MIRQRRELSKPRLSPQMREPPAYFFFIPRYRVPAFIKSKSPERLPVGRPHFKGFGVLDDCQGWPFAFSPNLTSRWSASGHCFSITRESASASRTACSTNSALVHFWIQNGKFHHAKILPAPLRIAIHVLLRAVKRRGNHLIGGLFRASGRVTLLKFAKSTRSRRLFRLHGAGHASQCSYVQ
jgi:hypothetical protein